MVGKLLAYYVASILLLNHSVPIFIHVQYCYTDTDHNDMQFTDGPLLLTDLSTKTTDPSQNKSEILDKSC